MATRTVEVPTGVPGLAPERALTWPARTKVRLSNGLEVILAESHSIPKFHGELFFRSGNAAVADVAAMADMGTEATRTAAIPIPIAVRAARGCAARRPGRTMGPGRTTARHRLPHQLRRPPRRRYLLPRPRPRLVRSVPPSGVAPCANLPKEKTWT